MPSVEAVSAQGSNLGVAPISVAASNATSQQNQQSMSTADAIALSGGLLAAGVGAGLIGLGVRSSIRKQRTGSAHRAAADSVKTVPASGQSAPECSAPDVPIIPTAPASGPEVSTPVQSDADLRLPADSVRLHHRPSDTHFYHEAQEGVLCAKHSFNAAMHALGAQPVTTDEYRAVLADRRAEFDPTGEAAGGFVTGDFSDIHQMIDLIQRYREIHPNRLPLDIKHEIFGGAALNEAGRTRENEIVAEQIRRLQPRAALTCRGNNDGGGHWAAIAPVVRPTGTRWKLIDSGAADSQNVEHATLLDAANAFTHNYRPPGMAFSRNFIFFH